MISRSLFLCLMNLIGLRIGVPYPILRLSFQMKAVELLVFLWGRESSTSYISKTDFFVLKSYFLLKKKIFHEPNLIFV